MEGAFFFMKNYQINNTKRINRLLNKVIENDLPEFCKIFFTSIVNTTQPSTQLRYAYDLKIFFRYIQLSNMKYANKNVHDFPIELLDEISAMEIEEYLAYLITYKNDKGKEMSNGNAGIKSKLIAVRVMYKYFFKHGLINKNVTDVIDIPKIKEKKIDRLTDAQVKAVLKNIEKGSYSNFSDVQKRWNKRFMSRDLAIISLLLGTGIRVSECAGIDIFDIDFKECKIEIIRKGGRIDSVYFSDEVKAALLNYYHERMDIMAKPGFENAFFLSKNKTRISVTSIEYLTHKYTKDIKDVTPHKLRATFGTNMYRATRDIYLVANTLGHRNVNTTKQHYADLQEDVKKEVRNVIKLRK